MKQLASFLAAIRVRNTKKDYYATSIQAKLHGAEMTTTLDDILSVGSNQSAFEKDQDEMFKKLAEQRLKEQQWLTKNFK